MVVAKQNYSFKNVRVTYCVQLSHDVKEASAVDPWVRRMPTPRLPSFTQHLFGQFFNALGSVLRLGLFVLFVGYVGVRVEAHYVQPAATWRLRRGRSLY